jgi:transketolase
VLSAGHGSMLIYARAASARLRVGVARQIKKFRQLGSLTPGHPENFITPASRPPPARSARGSPTRSAWRSRSGISPPNSATTSSITRPIVLASDGDLMEGISQEAIALAGHLKLNKLIVLFDDNGISIDGRCRSPTRSIR